MKKLPAIVLLLLQILNAHSQSGIYHSPHDYLNFKITQGTDIEKLSVHVPGTDYYLSPNTASTTRFSSSYKFLSVGFNTALKFLPANSDNDIKGKTETLGFSLQLFPGKWIQDLSFRNITGFYLENTPDFDPQWMEGTPYIKFPNLSFTGYEGMTAYKFNNNFSVKAVTVQTERQIRSTGSFIPGLLYRYYIIDDQTPLTTVATTQKSKNIELVLNAGYHYTLVFAKYFYASLGVTPGAGYIFTNVATRSPMGNTRFNQRNAVVRAEGRAGIGYIGERFLAGAFVDVSTATARQQNTSVLNGETRTIARIFIGYSINAPKKLERAVDEVYNRIMRIAEKSLR